VTHGRPGFRHRRYPPADVTPPRIVLYALALMHREFHPGARALLATRPLLLAHVERVAEGTGGMGPV